MKALKPLTSVGEVQALIGLWTQSRRWVPQLSSVVAPLTDLTVKGVKWRWGSKEQAAFEAGRDALYRPDYNVPIRVQTDASEHGVGGRIYQLVPEPRNIGF
jgi:hypothetical protein